MRSTIVLAVAVLTAGCDRQVPPAPQGNVASEANVGADAVQPDEVTEDTAPAKGGAIDTSHAGEPAPVHAFTDATGATKTLADFRGRPTLVNLWATWCVPCIRELPTLDALAARDAGKLDVLLVSQDTDASRVPPFVTRRGVKAPVFTDATMAWLPSFTATLPTTVLYDSAGKEVFRVIGDRDWTSAETAAAIGRAK